MSGFRPCHRCPTAIACAASPYAGKPRDCAGVLAADRARAGTSGPPEPVAPPTDPQMTLREAAEVVVRHWQQLGARGFEAAIALLQRVLERG